jgi:hypothetical protein
MLLTILLKVLFVLTSYQVQDTTTLQATLQPLLQLLTLLLCVAMYSCLQVLRVTLSSGLVI